MNKAYFFLPVTLLISIMGVRAQATIDFESEGIGASYTWSTFENDDNPQLAIVANPDATGVNTSATVARFTARTAGQPYAGTESAHGDFGPLTFSASNSTVKIMVYKSVISDVGLKFAESNGEAQPEVKVANTKINEWEELTFDLSGSIGKGITGVLDQIIVFPDFADRSQDNVIYFDNISFSTQSQAGVPTEEAPAPTTAAENVISIFSDVYDDVADTNFDPDWGQTTDATQVDIAGNATLKYENLNYQGTVLGSSQDVSGLKSIHIDFWTSDATLLEISLISTGPLENKTALDITKDEWVSVDVPLSEFTVPALDDIIQLKFDGNGTVYLDNIYFTSEEFTVPTETALSDLLVDGETIADFSANQLDYIHELAEGTTVVPTITAIAEDNTSSIVITPASEIPGATKVEVTAAGDGSKTTYSVAFKIEEVEVPPTSLPIDFEGEAYGFVDFDGGTGTVIANPQMDDDNSSAHVAQIVRNGGAVWAGSKLILEDKIDFSVNNSFSMKVYSTRVDVPILFKLEGPNAAKEISMSTTVANAWEIITWDFTETPSNTYNELVFIFDFGAVGDGGSNSTFLFDDIEFFDNTGGLSQIDLPVDFEDATVNYTLTDFGENSTVLGADPDDASNKVAITTKTPGAATWAGTTVGTPFGFDSKIPFTESETMINVKVYSPAAGLPIRLKVEDHNDVTLTAETEAITTKADAWEVLTFDFGQVVEGTNPFNLATNFDMLSIFFNFGAQGTGQVFYWDDVFFGQGEEPALGLFVDPNIKIFSKNGNLLINGDETIAHSRVEVYDLFGRKLMEEVMTRPNAVLKINQSGVLIVRISDANRLLSRKIFVE